MNGFRTDSARSPLASIEVPLSVRHATNLGHLFHPSLQSVEGEWMAADAARFGGGQ